MRLKVSLKKYFVYRMRKTEPPDKPPPPPDLLIGQALGVVKVKVYLLFTSET